MVSRQEQAVIGYLVGTVFILVLAGVFFFMWNDRRRKKRYIALQKELMQKRVDTMELREEKAMESEEEHINKLVELGERQFKLCMSGNAFTYSTGVRQPHLLSGGRRTVTCDSAWREGDSPL